jgi:hypothetical protein
MLLAATGACDTRQRSASVDSGATAQPQSVAAGAPSAVFAISNKGDRIVVTATGGVRIDGRIVTPRIQCRTQQWPGSTLVFDAANRVFVPERSVCVPRQ